MNIATITILALCAVFTPLASAQGGNERIVKKGDDGEVLFRGIIRKDVAGKVVGYMVYDAKGNKIKSVSFRYSLKIKPGKSIEARVYGPTGEMEGRIFRTQNGFTLLSKKGELLRQYPNGIVDSHGVIDACIASDMLLQKIDG